VAYHEAGHAVVGQALAGVTVPHKVTIVPRGETQGYMWGIDQEQRPVLARSVLVNQLAMMLAGRAAEELVLGEGGAGAAEDLARAGMLARRMVCEFGMSDALGLRSFGPVDEGLPAYSEDEARTIGVEVARITDEAHRLARRVLDDRRPALERTAAALLEHETLTSAQLDVLLTRAPVGYGAAK
jgi:cell division protease FtsH